MAGVTLKQYVDTRGVHKVAALCRVTPQTIYNWVNFQNAPDAFMCHLMIDDSMSMLTFESILSPYVWHNYEVIKKHTSQDFTSHIPKKS